MTGESWLKSRQRQKALPPIQVINGARKGLSDLLRFTQFRGKEAVELYLHSPVCHFGLKIENLPYLVLHNLKLLQKYNGSNLQFNLRYINKIQQDATVCRYLFTSNLLYMFRVSIAPIIKST